MTPPCSATPPETPLRRLVLAAPGAHEGKVLADILRQETVGGAVLLVMAAVGVAWANSPWGDAYESFKEFHLGPLTLEHWAADGGLALFFFIAGLELKREVTVGSLSNAADALVPVAAAIAGMVVPAGIYLAVNAAGGDLGGWAVPMATDIAFALAVLAVVGRSLPASLRAFLLTLAVVDDLGAILVIATVFTSGVALLPLAGAAGFAALYALLQRRRLRGWYVYLPIALATWWLVYNSGVHATIAGVALGLLTRVRPDEHEVDSPAERIEHRLRPLSAGFAVPFFALMSAGVAVSGGSGLVTDPIVVGVVLGLLLGKTVGVLAGAWVVTKLTRAELDSEIAWRDIVGIAALSGVGFTVSLLIADLSFDGGPAAAAKTAVIAGSLLSGTFATLVLRRRNLHHRSRDTA